LGHNRSFARFVSKNPHPNTKSNEMNIPKSSSTKAIPLETLRNVSNATVPELRAAAQAQELRAGDAVDIHGVNLIEEVVLLAIGGYHSVWLVKLRQSAEVSCTPYTHIEYC
jgi:hypothetical protein